MKVSFITPVFNEEATIGPYLESLASQSRKPDEVIIADGSSTDRTVEEIRARSGLFSKLRVIVRQCNIAAGRNLAAQEATGEIIAMSDAGCILDKKWLEEIIRPLEEDPSADICVGNWCIETTPGLPALLRWYFVQTNPGMRDGPKPMMPSARSVAVRRKVWVEMGGHPEFLYAGEDTLFNQKCQLRGKRFVFAEKAMCTWLMHRTLRRFGRQVRNYARAGGRLARAESRTALSYHLRNFTFYGVAFLGVGVGFFLADHWRRAVWVAITIAVAAALYRQKGEEFGRARRFGFGIFRALFAVFVTFYADWKTLSGSLAGFRDRARGDYEKGTLRYMAGPLTNGRKHGVELKDHYL